MEKYFRWIPIIQLLLLMIWFFMPWDFAYKNQADMALTWAGANALLDRETTFVLSNFLTGIYAVAYIGLFFLQRWARILFLILCIFGGFIIPVYGISVQSGIESMLGYFMSLIDGVLIAVLYFTNASKKFNVN